MSSLYFIRDFSFKYPFSQNKISIYGSMSILKNDIVLLTGKSGSGKSTLLYALKGLFPNIIKGTFTGEILYKGQLIQNLSMQDRLKIALVQQNPDNQIINRLVSDELAFGLENLQFAPETIQKRILEILHKFNLEYLLKRDMNSLSGGEKQKIALLSVLLTNPEVILLDEPTAFLDPQSANSFMQLIYNIRRDKTIIIIEHNIQYVTKLINKQWHIDSSGEVTQVPCLFEQESKYKTFLPPLPTTDELLSVKNLFFSYESTKIIDDLSFSLNAGEIVGVIGRSGVGKSTLLKLIARIIKTKNKIFLLGKDIANYTQKDFYSKVGLLFQNPENHFLLTSVAQELNNDDNLLDFLDLVKVREQNPFNLSQGQKRRLSLGILLINKKRELYLLDEPTFGQDRLNKDKIKQLINKMQQGGSSFIIVSHDYEFINYMCNKVITFPEVKI